MKSFIALFALVAVASAFPGIYETQGWHDPWKSSHGWQDPWQAKNAWNPWNPWQQNAWNPWQQSHHHHHEPDHHHVIQVAQPHPIPPLHPKPLHLKVHSESVRLHYDHPKVHHPHLIGWEKYHEPEIEVKPVHHGHGWA